MENKRITQVTQHSVVSGSDIIVAANGSRERIEFALGTGPYCNVDIYLDSTVSGNLVASINNSYYIRTSLDASTVGDLVTRRFAIHPITPQPTVVIGIIESVVSGSK